MGELAKSPRFPFAAAALCAACVGTAAWLWMRYSYTWDVTPADFYTTALGTDGPWPLLDAGFEGRYVRLRASSCTNGGVEQTAADPDEWKTGLYWAEDDTGCAISVRVDMATAESQISQPVATSFVGRVVPQSAGGMGSHIAMIDTTAARIAPRSLAVLVVGVMGCFVFTVAFRHWLKERRRYREATDAV